MFGAEVLIWTSDLSQVSSPWQVIKNYLFQGSPGHSALKLTLPATPENTALIKSYCQNEEGKMIIPHYQEEVIVTGKRHDRKTGEVRYYPKKENGWVVYFSWWPKGLNHEHKDRIIENRSVCAVYEPQWESYLEVKYRSPQIGLIGAFLGKLSNLIWPDKVAVPIEEIYHPHPQRESLSKALNKAQTDYTQVKQRFKKNSHEIQILKADNIYRQILSDREESKVSSGLFSCFLPQFIIDESCSYTAFQAQKILENKQRLAQLKEEKRHLSRIYDALETKLNKLKQEFYSKVATCGIRPTYTFNFPINGLVSDFEGLELKKMLLQMNAFAKQEESFHILDNNCSTTVLEIIRAGISPKLGSLCPTFPGVVETPDRLVGLMEEFEKAFATYRMATISKSLAEAATEPYEESVHAQKPVVNQLKRKHVASTLEYRKSKLKRALL